MKFTEPPTSKPRLITYEVVSTTFHRGGALPADKQPTYVTQKIDRSGLYPGGGSIYYSETRQEFTLEQLLTKIIQGIEALGLEFVMTDAKPATSEWRKKTDETSTASP